MNQTRKSKKRIKKREERPPLKSYWIEWREEEESERTDGESTSQEEKEEEKEEKKGEICCKIEKSGEEINLQPSPFSRHVSLTVLHMTMSIRRDCDGCSGCCEDDVLIAWWGVDAVDANLQLLL